MNLEDIKARVEAATAGPWFREYGDIITSDEDPRQSEQDADGNGPSLRIFEKAPHLDSRDRQGIDNATFVAHARTDVPKLVAALEAVLALHQPFEWSFGFGPVKSCRECADGGMSEQEAEYPCHTVRVLNGALGD